MRAAELCFQIQRYDQAIEFLTRAHQLSPDNYGVIVNLGNAHFDTNRYEEAERWHAQALQCDADDRTFVPTWDSLYFLCRVDVALIYLDPARGDDLLVRA